MLIAFNRPKLTKQVLGKLREVKPERVYFAVDGPRPDNFADEKKVTETREVIKLIDWPCRIKTLFSNKNLGCKTGPFKAMDWFFSFEDEGIILEDDVLPNTSFFYFCEELLAKYRNDTRIASISGNNFQFGKNRTEDSYYFSRFSHTWGWATWKRVWRLYDLEIKPWPTLKKEGWLKDYLPDRKSVRYWTLIFDQIYGGRIDSAWDYQFTFTIWINNMISILPSQNLAKNIGFGLEEATHTKRKSKLLNIPAIPIKFPLKHPKFIIVDQEADKRTQKNNYVLWKEIVMSLVRRWKR